MRIISGRMRRYSAALGRKLAGTGQLLLSVNDVVDALFLAALRLRQSISVWTR